MAGKFSKVLFNQQDDTQIDMTPMLDVVFIMLIFFIVSTSFIKETGVEVDRPVASTSQSQAQSGILIAINGQNEIWIDQRPVDLRAVRSNVQRLKAESPTAGVVIQADSNAPTGLLVQVMDQIRLAGITDIAIAADTP